MADKSAHFTVAYSDKFGKSEHAARADHDEESDELRHHGTAHGVDPLIGKVIGVAVLLHDVALAHEDHIRRDSGTDVCHQQAHVCGRHVDLR